jgi:hypothetical protein
MKHWVIVMKVMSMGPHVFRAGCDGVGSTVMKGGCDGL